MGVLVISLIVVLSYGLIGALIAGIAARVSTEWDEELAIMTIGLWPLIVVYSPLLVLYRLIAGDNARRRR